MKKPTIKKLKSQCDKIWAQVILAKYPTCVVCNDNSKHPHHLLPRRRYLSMRWNIKNGIGMCQKCHYLLALDPLYPHIKILERIDPVPILKDAALRTKVNRKFLEETKTYLANIAMTYPNLKQSADGATK